MAVYNFTQLEQLWEQAGGNPSVAPQAAALAIAETTGNGVSADSNAVNTANSDGSVDYGLWQINSIHNFDSSALLSNPSYNAQAAVSVYNSQGFSAWTTYGGAKYNQALSNGGYAAIGNVSGGSSTVTPVVAPSPLTNVLTGAFGEYGRWITNNNINVLYKTFVLIFGLLVLAAIPATTKFAGYAAFAVLFLLIIQDHDPNVAPATIAGANAISGI